MASPRRRHPSLPRLLVVAGALALPSAMPRAQAPPPPALAPPTFRSGVELITVDAVVLDRDGRPVSGLTREDFVVNEDGRPREIASFEAFVAGAPETEEEEAPWVVATNEPGPRGAGRAFAIVLDDVSLSQDQAEAARATAVQFVERFARERDLVTVATTIRQNTNANAKPNRKKGMRLGMGRILKRILTRSNGHLVVFLYKL